MGIEAQGKMVEQVDRDDKKEDKAANEVVDNVLTSTLASTTCMDLQPECDISSRDFSVSRLFSIF